MKNYYEILGVPINATIGEIKDRYHYLVFAYHPDRFTELQFIRQAEEDLKNINEAYDVLSDLKKRSEYDLLHRLANSSNTPRSDVSSKRKITRSYVEQLIKQKTGRMQPGLSSSNPQTDFKINLHGLDLKGLNLSGLFSLELVKDIGFEIDFTDSNLQDADLSENDFYSPIFTRANLNYTKFRGSSFACEEFDGALFSHTDFSGAFLDRHNLSGLDLPDCIFEKANLKYVKMIGSKLIDSNFRTYPKTALSKISAQAIWMKASQFSAFLHQRVAILRRLANQPSVLSTTQRRAGKVISPGIGHSSCLGSFLLRRCLMCEV